MERCRCLDCSRVWARLPCCLWTGRLKRYLWDIDLITFFGVRNLGDTSVLRVILFLKMFKFNVNIRNGEKNRGKVLYFWDNCIWIGCIKLSLFRREYLSSGVNLLTNSLKIFHSTKRDFFQLNYVHSDQWIWERCRRPDCNSVCAHLPCCFGNGPLKRAFSDNRSL